MFPFSKSVFWYGQVIFSHIQHLLIFPLQYVTPIRSKYSRIHTKPPGFVVISSWSVGLVLDFYPKYNFDVIRKITGRKLFSLCKVLLILVSLFSLVQMQGISVVLADDDYDSQIKDKEEEKEQKESELEDSENRQYSYLQEGLSINGKLSALDDDMSGLESSLTEGEDELAQIEENLKSKEEEKSEKQEEVSNITQSLYKFSRQNVFEVLFSAKGLEDLIQKLGFLKYGAGHLLRQLRVLQGELSSISSDYQSLSDEVSSLKSELDKLAEDKLILEGMKAMYERLAAEEAAKQNQLIGEIDNITAEQERLLEEKMKATEEDTTVGDKEEGQTELPDPPFSPAYAVASMGRPHRIGLSQYGAYGRSKAGQNYEQILSAYFNADLNKDFDVMDQIYVEGYGWMDFEDQYLKGIAEMPTYWAQSGGYEALKSQAVAARTYAVYVTSNGQNPICATQSCQVYYPSKVTDPAAADWHQAVADTRKDVLTYGGSPIGAYYASTAGGYTRLPSDFDIWGSSYSAPYLKRVRDYASDNKAYEGPSYGNSPWYYKVWYAQSDVHPWLTQEEMVDLLNAARLPSSYNSHLSHPDLGGWSHDQVRSELQNLGMTPISDIQGISDTTDSSGYTSSLAVQTSGETVNVDGIRFWQVYKLRSRGYLALWSSLYDIIVQ